MESCSICGKRILDSEEVFGLSKEMPDAPVCSSCVSAMRRIRQFGKSGDDRYKNAVADFTAVIEQYEPDDDVLEYIHRFLRRTNRIYDEACQGEGAAPIPPDSPPPGGNRRLLIVLGIVAALVLVIGIIVAVTNSGVGGKWICDDCGKEWRGEAYYGLQGDETMCSDCAVTYWSPLPYKNYVKEKTGGPFSNGGIPQPDSDDSADLQNGTTTSAELFYIAYGKFSEGKAYVQTAEYGGCYIDQGGKVLFSLPNDMPFGYDFNEGYAVITNKGYKHIEQQDTPELFRDIPYDIERQYALIDSTGNIVVPSGVYNYISSVSEGKLLCVTVDKAATGTVTTCEIKDTHNNTICVLEDSVGSNARLCNQPIICNGILYCFYVDGGEAFVVTFDMQGKRISKTEDVWIRARNSFTRIMQTGYLASVTSLGSYILESLTGEPKIRLKSCDRFDSIFSFDGYALQQNDEYSEKENRTIRYAWLIDMSGEAVTERFPIEGARDYAKNVDSNLWIVELSNNFYAAMTFRRNPSTNQLGLTYLFDPVQDRLEYLEEGFFWGRSTGNVYDITGTIKYVMPEGVEKVVEPYSEGYLVAGFDRWQNQAGVVYGNRYCYIDYDGNIVSSIDQFHPVSQVQQPIILNTEADEEIAIPIASYPSQQDAIKHIPGDSVEMNSNALEPLILEGKTRYYTEEELQSFSADDLRFIRNGMFALNGLRFDDVALATYFQGFSWYHATSSDDKAVYDTFTNYQKRNVSTILHIEKDKGYR